MAVSVFSQYLPRDVDERVRRSIVPAFEGHRQGAHAHVFSHTCAAGGISCISCVRKCAELCCLC